MSRLEALQCNLSMSTQPSSDPIPSSDNAEKRFLKIIEDFKKQLTSDLDKFRAEIKEELATYRKSISDEIQKTISDEIQKLNQSFQEDSTKLWAETTSLDNNATKMQEEIDGLKQDLEKSKLKATLLENKLELVTNRVIMQESYNRRENLIFCGINKENNENCTTKVKQFLKRNLKLTENVVNAMIDVCYTGNLSHW